MAAGDLIERVGQVEWGGILFDTRPSESGVWIPKDATRSGWHPTRKRATYPTEVGGVGGRRLWEPMFPAIDGVAFESPEALLGVMEAMDSDEPGVLAWWSFELDQVVAAEAKPELFEPVENLDAAHRVTRFADVMWLVERPGEIGGLEEIEGS